MKAIASAARRDMERLFGGKVFLEVWVRVRRGGRRRAHADPSRVLKRCVTRAIDATSEPAFVLHSYPYRETSAIVEALTAACGRVALVARGARRPRSELRGTLQAFQPLTFSWQGGGELKTLLKADWRGGLPRVEGSALLCGFYLNELLLKLLPREDPHPQLYAAYEGTLSRLAGGAEQAPLLRGFELTLLAELGYALPLTHEVESGRPIDPAGRYYYAFDRGPRQTVAEPGRRYPQVRGATLLALAQRDFSGAGGNGGSEAAHARSARPLLGAAHDRQPPRGARSAGVGGSRRQRQRGVALKP